MEHKTSKKEYVERTHSITCDICKTIYCDEFDWQEIIQIKHNCGYDSVFGDLKTLELDICQVCLKHKFSEYIRIKDNG